MADNERCYGGILVTSREVWIASGRTRDAGRSVSYQKIIDGMSPGRVSADACYFPYDAEKPRTVLSHAVKVLCEAEPTLRSIGVASYGPLLNVDAERKDRPDYGRVSPASPHKAIQNLNTYTTVCQSARRALGRDVDVVVQTDVMAGAYAEFARRSSTRCEAESDRIGERDVLAFLHVSDGIGGAFVSGGTPMNGALHPEVGYIGVTIDWRDIWGKRKLVAEEAVDHLVVIEDLASETALRMRAGLASPDHDHGRWIAQIPKPIWDIESSYIAQLCVSVAMMIVPHKIILHSDFVGPELLASIRGNFDRLITRRGKRFLGYAAMTDSDTFIRRPISPGPMRFGAVCLAVQADLSKGGR